MSQFDETTERKAATYYINLTWGDKGIEIEPAQQRKKGFYEGRNSAKESLEILARALDFHTGSCVTANGQRTSAAHAIAQVIARGDWPLSEEKGKA